MDTDILHQSYSDFPFYLYLISGFPSQVVSVFLWLLLIYFLIFVFCNFTTMCLTVNFFFSCLEFTVVFFESVVQRLSSVLENSQPLPLQIFHYLFKYCLCSICIHSFQLHMLNISTIFSNCILLHYTLNSFFS